MYHLSNRKDGKAEAQRVPNEDIAALLAKRLHFSLVMVTFDVPNGDDKNLFADGEQDLCSTACRWSLGEEYELMASLHVRYGNLIWAALLTLHGGLRPLMMLRSWH